MTRVLFFVVSLLFLCSCESRYDEGVRYHSDGTSRSSVMVAPVMDRAKPDLPWDVSTELTETLEMAVNRRGDIYLSSDYSAPVPTNVWNHPQGQEAQQFVNMYPRTDFVVLVELLEHEYSGRDHTKTQPIYADSNQIKAVLTLTARVQVLDLRHGDVRPVLQQIIPSNHMIPVVKQDVDYYQKPWGSDEYHATPVGMAHTKLTKDILDQVERYISFARKSKVIN
ncbi:MAG: hypothetical protein CMO81_02865 [Waddliaceae bacterium]|nr:hypothetical protein [Waddliaceae bacterium]